MVRLLSTALCAVVFVLLLAMPASADTTVDATAAWNSVAATYNFKATTDPDVTALTTFAGAYTGSDFAADFAAIKASVAQTLGCAIPPWTGEDELSATLPCTPLE